MNYLWIPLLIVLSKELTGSASANSTASPLLLLPSQADAFFAAPRCPPVSPELNFGPVIGILSHPGDGRNGSLCKNKKESSYIAASYVKFVESAGARVIPLIYNEPTKVLYKKLGLVNGVIFTGGRAKEDPYFKVVESIFKRIMRKNDAGDHFPLLAICLGFELLTMIVSKDKCILEKFSARDQASKLKFKNITMDETVFQRFPPALIEKLKSDCLVMQNHRFGISPKKFHESESLRRFFEILTTSEDQYDKVYVSTMRAYDYPVTAVQWHPEKNAFEWGKTMIPHSEDAIQVTQHVANFIVREARKSNNRPPVQEVRDNLIYNYNSTYCGKKGTGLDEVYLFQCLKRPSPGL